MIGNNNMFFPPETGIEPAAQGIQVCVANVRDKFPQAEVIVAKTLPAHAPGNRFYEDITKTNAALDPLQLDGDPKVHVLDLTNDFANADGTLKKELFTPDNIHLSLAGYGVYAERLKPLLDRFLGGRSVGGEVVWPQKATSASAPAQSPSRPVLASLANEGASLAECAWVAKSEYTRRPGHEVQKHLPEMWFVTPTAARWGKDGEENLWVALHATCVENLRLSCPPSQIVLVKILPAFDPSKEVGAKVREINATLDRLRRTQTPIPNACSAASSSSTAP